VNTPTPWRIVWKHDTHKVKRDKEGRILGPVTVPFEDYCYALECVNERAEMMEALRMARKKLEMWPEGSNPEYFPEVKAIDKALNTGGT
jgi:hypothetical protein